MEHSKSRLEYFSDAIMALCMVVLLFGMSVPNRIAKDDLISFFFSFRVFLVTFIVIGSMWNRHHRFIDFVPKISNKIIWRNLLFLFSLSIIPLSAKIIIENKDEIVPYYVYNIVFIVMNLFYYFFIRTIKKIDIGENSVEIVNYLLNFCLIYIIINITIFIILFVISQFFVLIPKIIFLLLPLLSCRINLFLKTKKYKKRKEN